MSDYLIWIILTSAWCFGFHNAFQSDMIFGKLGDYLRSKFSEKLLKPFIGCPLCMPSIHGTFIYLHACQGDYSVTGWLMFIVCASGINYVIYNLFPPTDINVKNHY